MAGKRAGPILLLGTANLLEIRSNRNSRASRGPDLPHPALVEARLACECWNASCGAFCLLSPQAKEVLYSVRTRMSQSEATMKWL